MDDLKVTRRVAPGDYGAIRETKRYGHRLFAVRYRRDAQGRYVKTVEIIVADRHE